MSNLSIETRLKLQNRLFNLHGEEMWDWGTKDLIESLLNIYLWF
jgi:hypothetical protein